MSRDRTRHELRPRTCGLSSYASYAESIDWRAALAHAGNRRTGDSGCRQVVDEERLGLGKYNKPGGRRIWLGAGRKGNGSSYEYRGLSFSPAPTAGTYG